MLKVEPVRWDYRTIPTGKLLSASPPTSILTHIANTRLIGRIAAYVFLQRFVSWKHLYMASGYVRLLELDF